MATGELNIALIEQNIIWGDKMGNITSIAQQINLLPKEIDLVILPEFFTTGFISKEIDTVSKLAETNNERTISELKKIACHNSVAIAGSFIARTGNKYYNRAFIIEPSTEVTFYDKRHLFSMSGEGDIFTKGEQCMPIIRYRGWNIAIAICYDLRFPEWLRSKNNSYDLLIIVANWPKARAYPWKHLLIARAIENQCYVAAVNRIGTDNYNIEYSGNSMIIDYKGNIIADINSPENFRSLIPTPHNIINTSIGLTSLNSFRSKFPVWKDASF